ncbi:MAG: hypothetical protein R3F53_27600 [Gammaproteobacteria bacterium]
MDKIDAVPPPQASKPGPVEDPDDLPDVTSELPELKIYSHSPIFYWWPVWVVGYILAFMSSMQGQTVRIDSGDMNGFCPRANPVWCSLPYYCWSSSSPTSSCAVFTQSQPYLALV